MARHTKIISPPLGFDYENLSNVARHTKTTTPAIVAKYGNLSNRNIINEIVDACLHSCSERMETFRISSSHKEPNSRGAILRVVF